MENSYIVTTTTEKVIDTDTLTWLDLQAASFQFNRPFKLQLTGGQVFNGEEVVRILPQKRLVAYGHWQGKPAIAKLFFDSRRAQQQMEKDAEGVKCLQKNKIPTPTIYYEGVCKDKQIYVLIFERIMNANTLADLWQNKTSMQAVLPILKSIVVELATQHVLGVKQRDLHFKNFLLTDNTIYTLDGGQIEVLSEALNIKASMENIALFLSQLGIGVEHYQDQLFRFYAEARSWLIKKEDVTDLFHSIDRWNKLRWKRFERKIFRNSSNYVRFQVSNKVGMYERKYETPDFLNLIKNLDKIFATPRPSQLMKAGNSATIIKVNIDGRDLVIKRYNIKNFRHFLRRCFRKTRAYKSWRLAQKFILFGIATAKPVAFLEEKYFGLKGKSYFITEYISEEHAGDYFFDNRHEENKIAMMINRIKKLFNLMTKLAVTHGDLKITNILIDKNEEPLLIDLDGAIEHGTVHSLERAKKRELERFLRNFLTLPSIYGQVKKAFEQE